jgi:hypothetical protein
MEDVCRISIFFFFLAIYRKTENYFFSVAMHKYSDLLRVSLPSLQEEYGDIKLYICCSSIETNLLLFNRTTNGFLSIGSVTTRHNTQVHITENNPRSNKMQLANYINNKGHITYHEYNEKQSKAIPVNGCEGP